MQDTDLLVAPPLEAKEKEKSITKPKITVSHNYPKFTLGEKLTDEQFEFYQEYGFLHFDKFITKEYVGDILNSVIKIQDEWVKEDRKKIFGVPIKYGKDVDGSTIVQRFAFTSLHSPAVHDLLKDTRFKALFSLLEQDSPRIGEMEKDGVVLNHYVNTDQSKFARMGWHTDALRDVFYGKKIMPMLNVGLHLDKCTMENGGLRIIPGTHKQSLRKMVFRKKYFIDHEPDPQEMGIEVNAGDLTVHDGRLWHRVAQSPIQGEQSRRRVMYIPFVTGTYAPKSEKSKTKLYHRFMSITSK